MAAARRWAWFDISPVFTEFPPQKNNEKQQAQCLSAMVSYDPGEMIFSPW
jgi:hypothetical protein